MPRAGLHRGAAQRKLATVVVIGLALEVAGAALLAAELLTLDTEVLARRGNLILQSGEPHLWAQLPSARTFVGFGLLLAGFVVQIGGYEPDDLNLRLERPTGRQPNR